MKEFIRKAKQKILNFLFKVKKTALEVIPVGIEGYGFLLNNGSAYGGIWNNSGSDVDIGGQTGSTNVNFRSNGTTVGTFNLTDLTMLIPVVATKFQVSSLNTAPSSASATGTTGEIRITSDYIYICVATNTWKRVAISTW